MSTSTEDNLVQSQPNACITRQGLTYRRLILHLIQTPIDVYNSMTNAAGNVPSASFTKEIGPSFHTDIDQEGHGILQFSTAHDPSTLEHIQGLRTGNMLHTP